MLQRARGTRDDCRYRHVHCQLAIGHEQISKDDPHLAAASCAYVPNAQSFYLSRFVDSVFEIRPLSSNSARSRPAASTGQAAARDRCRLNPTARHSIRATGQYAWLLRREEILPTRLSGAYSRHTSCMLDGRGAWWARARAGRACRRGMAARGVRDAGAGAKVARRTRGVIRWSTPTASRHRRT